MRLHYLPGACSLSPHIVALEAGFDPDLDRVDRATYKTESGEDYLKINPNGYVPALVLDDGTVLTEGPAIVQYLADLRPEAGLVPPAGTIERAQLQSKLNFISTELHKSFGVLFTPAASDAEKDRAREKLAKRYDYVERVLGESGPYLGGKTFSVADAYLFVVTNWAGHTGLDLSGRPHVQDFMARVGARPKVQAALRAEGLI